MIRKTLFQINKHFGKFFFGNPNSLYYNIFNKMHFHFIANKNHNESIINEYVKKGFVKTNINSKALCEYISSEIKKQSPDPNQSFYNFTINDEMKRQIKDHINSSFSEILKKLENFYNSKISVASVRIRRNYHINESIDKEVYSNNYHVDHYVYNHFKVFINLMNVNIDQGPLHIYSKNDTKKFLKLNKYKSRSNYIKEELSECLNINSGKVGESFLANTTECLHKAGYVKKGNYRDILFITFVTIPEKILNYKDFFYYDDIYPNSIWVDNKSEIIKIAKPKSLKKTIKLFYKYYKNKIN